MMDSERVMRIITEKHLEGRLLSEEKGYLDAALYSGSVHDAILALVEKTENVVGPISFEIGDISYGALESGKRRIDLGSGFLYVTREAIDSNSHNLGLVANSFAALATIYSALQKSEEKSETQRIKADQYRADSLTDSLTGVGNHKALSLELSLYLNEARDKDFRKVIPGASGNSNDCGICMILMDIDRFKLFNDKYGHAEGNTALQYFGQWLNEFEKRKTDKVYRFGGEEFVILLPDCNLSKAVDIADYLREKVKLHSTVLYNTFDDAENRLLKSPFTFSAGVANNRELSASMCYSPAAFFELCDQRLYSAKKTRDAVVGSVIP